MEAPPSPHRRVFLSGIAAAGLLAACGSDGGVTTEATVDDGSSPPAGSGIVGELSTARFFGPYFLAGAVARVPFGLADDEGLVPTEAMPDEVTVRVDGPDGTTLVRDVPATGYTEGLPRGYYVVTFTPEVAGFHDLVIDTPLGQVVTQVQVVEADDPVASAILAPGAVMPALETPTVDDARGVDPICTRTPPCDLHGQTVAEVVGGSRPSVVLVATPAFCQTVICGPVLDLLLAEASERPDVDFVHVEVFADPDENSSPPRPEDFAPAVTALGLAFEPVLFTVDAAGVVVERLDYIFGAAEIHAAVGRLVA